MESKTMFSISAIIKEIVNYKPYKIPSKYLNLSHNQQFEVVGDTQKAVVTVVSQPDETGIGIFEVEFQNI